MQDIDSSMFSGTRTQLCAAISGTLFAISDGMSYGWTAPVIPYLISEKSHLKTTKFEAEWLESCLMLGSFFGLPFTIFSVDKIGRKKSLLLAAITSLISWVMIATADRMMLIFIARFMFGVTANTSFVAAPMYVAEIADHKIRGLLSSVIYINMLLGLVIVYSVGPFLPFYVPPLVGICVLSVELCTFYSMPESPYYLLQQGNTMAAKKSLQYFRPKRDIVLELRNISKAVQRQKSEPNRLRDLFMMRNNRKAIIIMTVLDIGQHLCAISVILMNLHIILEAAGSIYVDSNIAAILFAIIMLVAACWASFQVDKYGRKALILLSTILTGISLISMAIYFHLKLAQYDVRVVSWIPIVAVMIYAASFKIGIGIIPIVLTAELFPSNIKASGMAIADLMYVTGSIVSLQCYQWLSSTYGIHVPFYIFAFSSFLIAYFTSFYIPETKGKTLEEIQYLLKGEEYGRNNSMTNSMTTSMSNSMSCKSYNTFI